MTVDAYFNPDFTTPEKLFFLLVAFLGILIADLLIIFGKSFAFQFSKERRDKNKRNMKILEEIQLFYEMIISATSVMSFACAYVILNHVYSLAVSEGIKDGYLGIFVDAWGEWKDFILLLLILLSCILNTILDKLIIPLKRIESEKIATVRMLAMFYAIIVLLCLNVYGDDSEYNPVMMYYLGLMVGRFVYFDASFGDFLMNIKYVILRSPLLLLGLSLTGALSYFGFHMEYFLERNYYIVGVFYAHLFMLAAVFILHHSHIFNLIFRTKERKDDPPEDQEDYEDPEDTEDPEDLEDLEDYYDDEE